MKWSCRVNSVIKIMYLAKIFIQMDILAAIYVALQRKWRSSVSGSGKIPPRFRNLFYKMLLFLPMSKLKVSHEIGLKW